MGWSDSAYICIRKSTIPNSLLINMNRFITLIAITFILIVSAGASERIDLAGELEKIKANYRLILVPKMSKPDSLTAGLMEITPEKVMSDQVVIELHERYPFNMDKVKSYMSQFNDDGSWADLNYDDTRRSGWDPKRHADRVLEMVKIYKSEGMEMSGSPELKDKIHRALGYWFRTKPKCLNWWQNEIGVPKTLGPACILIEDELSESEKQGIIDVVSAARFKMTGQNKVWLAGNVLLRGLLQGDAQLVKQARDTIMSEITVGKAEGIKSDWSFHQHGPQQQFGNYGLAYISGMGFYHKLFKGTAYRFDEEQEDVLRSFINNGFKWVIWNRYMDVSALGRQFFHNAQLHKAYSLAFTATDFGIDGFKKSGNQLVRHKHFYDSDYTVHRANDWMASLKMSSSRVIGTEVVNEDNLLGYYLGDGATFFYVRGDEYNNVFPFWDWRKIPGVTAYEDDAPIPNIRKNKSRNKSPLVGGIDYGNYGVSVMTLDRDGLTARKAWFFTDEYVFCFASGISSDSLLHVTSSIDSRWRHGDLSVFESNRWRNIEGEERFSSNIIRFHHDSVGYVVMPTASVSAFAGKKTGDWSDFMKMYAPEKVEGDVMSLHLRHGVSPVGDSYRYFVLPACGKETVASFNPARQVKIHRDDAGAMIVELLLPKSQMWVISYTGEPVDVNGKSFAPESPGIYLVERDHKKLVSKVFSKFEI